jgi:alpha/beta superfamily hydrolase
MNQNMLRSIFLIIFITLPLSALTVNQTHITVKGKDYSVVETRLESVYKEMPLLVIAPAKKVTMYGELFEKMANSAASLGYFVVRFNWGFMTAEKEPSPNLSQEVEDLENIVTYYGTTQFVNASSIIVATKSFGTQVAAKSFFRKLKGLLLLTPNCSREEPFEKVYGPILSSQTPTHIVISALDDACDVKQIYKGFGRLNLNFTLHTTFGDHNFLVGKDDTDKWQEKAALASSLAWLAQMK